MENYNIIIWSIFALFASLIIIEPRFSLEIYYLPLRFWIHIRRLYLMFKLHPRNFVTTWIMNQKYAKMTKQQEKDQ